MTQEKFREERVREDQVRTEREPALESREPMQAEREPMQREREPMPADREAIQREREPSSMAGGEDLSEYRGRFEQLQAQFIDEPQAAVRSAETLVKEAVDRMMRGTGGHHGGNDTEQLRLAMKRYRALIFSLTDNGGPD